MNITTENPDEDNGEIILTEEQKLKILEMLNINPPPKIKDIGKEIFGKDIDARELEGRVIRQFIKEKGLTFRNARTWIPEKVIELTEEQKTFISNNINSVKPLEMSRILFKNDRLTQLDLETRAIYTYIKTLPPNITNAAISKEECINTEDYRPPKTESECIARINKYVLNANLERQKLNEKQKRDIRNLIGYLHSARYLSQIAMYSLESDRILFESEFIRCTYDKALTEEEVSQYIIYATEVIIGRQISKRIEQLENEQDNFMEENNGKLNQGLVEAVRSLRNEFNQCITRQRALLKSLQGERNQRIKNEAKDRTSLVDLVMFWQNEEKRQQMIQLAELRREKIKEEIDRLKNMDELKCQIWGINPEEIIGE